MNDTPQIPPFPFEFILMSRKNVLRGEDESIGHGHSAEDCRIKSARKEAHVRRIFEVIP